MRKLVGGFATSIDGFIQGPAGEIDWIIYDKDQFKELEQSWKKTDAMLHGRKTYEEAYTKLGKKAESQWKPFAHMKHYVFSKTLDKIDDKFILVKGDLKTEVEKIKNQEGGEIAVFGGAELLGSLIKLDLVDELTLAICPVLLGKGKAFFPSLEKRSNWKLKEAKTYASGLVSLTYSRLEV